MANKMFFNSSGSGNPSLKIGRLIELLVSDSFLTKFDLGWSWNANYRAAGWQENVEITLEININIGIKRLKA